MSDNNSNFLGRRKFLKRSGLAMAGAPLLSMTSRDSKDVLLNEDKKSGFTFVFMTDIHIKPEMNAPLGFQMAIDKVNTLAPDFVITGGDLVYDVMRGSFERSDALFKLYEEMSKGFEMPVHNCIGNHDLFGIYEESPEDETHSDYKYGMWERYFGNTYYAFDHKGWHFITLNSLDVTDDKRYKGFFHSEQLEWLKGHLETVDKDTPIVITTHIPLLCTFSQLYGKEGSRTANNGADVFKVFENHNLKLVLQGHIHWMEYGNANNRVQFLTGGSIAGNGWKGRRHNTREGFMKINVKDDSFEYEYVDHGWEAERLRLAEMKK